MVSRVILLSLMWTTVQADLADVEFLGYTSHTGTVPKALYRVQQGKCRNSQSSSHSGLYNYGPSPFTALNEAECKDMHQTLFGGNWQGGDNQLFYTKATSATGLYGGCHIKQGTTSLSTYLWNPTKSYELMAASCYQSSSCERAVYVAPNRGSSSSGKCGKSDSSTGTFGSSKIDCVCTPHDATVCPSYQANKATPYGDGGSSSICRCMGDTMTAPTTNCGAIGSVAPAPSPQSYFTYQQTNCQAVTERMCAANEWCIQGECKTNGPCPNDSTKVTSVTCTCGTATCNPGQKCDAGVCKDNTCDASRNTPLSASCKCGTADCASGEYCFGGACYTAPECTNTDGQSAVGSACDCGTDRCSANEYCFNNQCHADCGASTTLNSAACKCGTSFCAANQYCDGGVCSSLSGGKEFIVVQSGNDCQDFHLERLTIAECYRYYSALQSVGATDGRGSGMLNSPYSSFSKPLDCSVYDNAVYFNQAGSYARSQFRSCSPTYPCICKTSVSVASSTCSSGSTMNSVTCRCTNSNYTVVQEWQTIVQSQTSAPVCFGNQAYCYPHQACFASAPCTEGERTTSGCVCDAATAVECVPGEKCNNGSCSWAKCPDLTGQSPSDTPCLCDETVGRNGQTVCEVDNALPVLYRNPYCHANLSACSRNAPPSGCDAGYYQSALYADEFLPQKSGFAVNNRSECTACDYGKFQPVAGTLVDACATFPTCVSGKSIQQVMGTDSETVCDDCEYHGAGTEFETFAVNPRTDGACHRRRSWNLNQVETNCSLFDSRSSCEHEPRPMPHPSTYYGMYVGMSGTEKVDLYNELMPNHKTYPCIWVPDDHHAICKISAFLEPYFGTKRHNTYEYYRKSCATFDTALCVTVPYCELDVKKDVDQLFGYETDTFPDIQLPEKYAPTGEEGCLREDACNFNPAAVVAASEMSEDRCWFPFDCDNYVCHATRFTNPMLDEYTQSWRVNPGQCRHDDDDNNGWCDDLDEVFGCMDRRACNSGTSIRRGEAKRARGDECESDAQCISQRCALCDGTFRCTEYTDSSVCSRRVRNREHITRGIRAFCRFPYSKEFKCKKNDILFSSLQGIEISQDEQGKDKTSVARYIASTREVRKQMIRCINVPKFDSLCENLDVIDCDVKQRTHEFDWWYPRDVCCKCDGGRLFDTDRGTPVIDIERDMRPDSWLERGCARRNACNYNPFADPGKFDITLSLDRCKYDDADNDGVCDSILTNLVAVCNVWGATNYRADPDPQTERIDNTLCEFSSTTQYDACQEYKPRYGCKDASACNYDRFASQHLDFQCTHFEPTKTCSGESLDLTIFCKEVISPLHGDSGDCGGYVAVGANCTSTCDPGYSASVTSRHCDHNGTLAPFECALQCAEHQYFVETTLTCTNHTDCPTGEYETSPPTEFSNRVCATNQCTCLHGQETSGANCAQHLNASCASCNLGYRLDEDNICVFACSDGQYYDSVNQTCTNHTACLPGEYVTSQGSTFRDRVCAPNQCTCLNGRGTSGASCLQHGSQSTCLSCNDRYDLMNGTCVLQLRSPSAQTFDYESCGVDEYPEGEQCLTCNALPYNQARCETLRVEFTGLACSTTNNPYKRKREYNCRKCTCLSEY